MARAFGCANLIGAKDALYDLKHNQARNDREPAKTERLVVQIRQRGLKGNHEHSWFLFYFYNYYQKRYRKMQL